LAPMVDNMLVQTMARFMLSTRQAVNT